MSLYVLLFQIVFLINSQSWIYLSDTFTLMHNEAWYDALTEICLDYQNPGSFSSTEVGEYLLRELGEENIS